MREASLVARSAADAYVDGPLVCGLQSRRCRFNRTDCQTPRIAAGYGEPAQSAPVAHIIHSVSDDRSDTIVDIVVYLLLAAGGVWLIVKFDGSAGPLTSFLHGVGYVLAGQGLWIAVREFRRLFEPEVVAAIEAEEAERERLARDHPAMLVSVVFFWLLTLLAVGGFVFYLLDDSGLHGERTVMLTVFFGGLTVGMVGFAVAVTRSWWCRRKARIDQSAVVSV